MKRKIGLGLIMIGISISVYFFINNYRHNEYKLSIDINQNYVKTLGKSIKTYNRETINDWLRHVKAAEKADQIKFNPGDAVGGVMIHQEIGLGYYISNIYFYNGNIYMSSMDHSEDMIKFDIKTFQEIDRNKENLMDYFKYNLKLPQEELEFN